MSIATNNILRRFQRVLQEAIPTKEIVCAAMRKNVATCDIDVAIEHFLATFWFLWR
jgi:hypothetical protein